MALVHTDAIVLRSYNLADADRIVLCLTRSAGLVRAVAKGARKMKSRFGAALEPFTLIKLIFHEKENRELVTLSQADILQSHFDLAAEPEAVKAFAYMTELIVEFAPPHHSDEKLFRMVTACVEAIAHSPAGADSVVRYFEIWALRLAGFMPDLKACADCGTSLTRNGAFLNAEAKARCRSCSRGTGAILSPESLALLFASRRQPPLVFAADLNKLGPSFKAQVADFTRRLLLQVLERPPRTSTWVEPSVQAAGAGEPS